MSDTTGRTSFVRLLASVLLIFAIAVPAQAKKADKCEGTKKQRKQKMEKRVLTDAQLEEMIRLQKQTVTNEQELMKEALVRRIGREYEVHKATGEPFVYDMLIISGGGAKGAFGAGFFEG